MDKEMPAVRRLPENNRFVIDIGTHRAHAEYEEAPGLVTFTHTFVPEALRGQGIATQLVQAGLGYARTQGLQVIPRCDMFAAYMRDHPETHDLLTPAERARLDR